MSAKRRADNIAQSNINLHYISKLKVNDEGGEGALKGGPPFGDLVDRSACGDGGVRYV